MTDTLTNMLDIGIELMKSPLVALIGPALVLTLIWLFRVEKRCGR